MKKLLSLFLAVGMLLTMVSATGAVSFADAGEITYSEAVLAASDLGLFSGSNGKFNPKGTVTRAQMAAICAKMYYGPDVNANTYKGANWLSDTAKFEGGWADGYINLGLERGWFKGYGDGTFRPGQAVNTAEAITMILNVLAIDAGQGTWPITVMAAAEEYDLFGMEGGYELNSVPGMYSELTREQLAVITMNGLTYRAGIDDNAWYTAGGTADDAEETEDTGDRVAATGISLDITSHTMGEDWTQYLTATLTPAGAKDTITWTSSNPRVATVSAKGKVSGVAGGETVITATTSNGLTATCKVEVWHSHELVFVDAQYKGTVEYYYCDCGHSYENWIPREFKKYTNWGFVLNVPAEYDDLLIVEKGKGDLLFAVYEKASWEAGKKKYGYEGCGYLVGIYRVDGAGVGDFYAANGCEILARDAKGYYYVADRPSGVEFYRTDIYDYGGESYHPDWESWCELDHWAARVVTKEFVEEHAGLREMLDIDLELGRWNDDIWRSLYEEWGMRWDKPEYLIQKSDEKTAHVSGGTQSDTYLEKLGRDVIFTRIEDESFVPNGPCISFRVREEQYGTIYDVFTGAGEQHIIRRRPSRAEFDENYNVHQYYIAEDWEYYTVTKNGKNFNAGKVVTDWWNAVNK